jgi:hypothetical protein
MPGCHRKTTATPIATDVESDAGDQIIAVGPTTIAVLQDYLRMRDGTIRIMALAHIRW